MTLSVVGCVDSARSSSQVSDCVLSMPKLRYWQLMLSAGGCNHLRAALVTFPKQTLR